jgi:acetyl esterase
VIAESSAVREEAEAYAGRLAAAGVRVVSVRYHGPTLDCLLLDVLADTPGARDAMSQGACFLRDALV